MGGDARAGHARHSSYASAHMRTYVIQHINAMRGRFKQEARQAGWVRGCCAVSVV